MILSLSQTLGISDAGFETVHIELGFKFSEMWHHVSLSECSILPGLLEHWRLMHCDPSIWWEPFTQQYSVISQKTWILNHTALRNSNLMIYLNRLVRREYLNQHSDRFVYIAICSGTEVTVGVSVCIMSHTNSLYLDMGTEVLGLDGFGSSARVL